MRISDWSSDVCSSDLASSAATISAAALMLAFRTSSDGAHSPALPLGWLRKEPPASFGASWNMLRWFVPEKQGRDASACRFEIAASGLGIVVGRPGRGRESDLSGLVCGPPNPRLRRPLLDLSDLFGPWRDA